MTVGLVSGLIFVYCYPEMFIVHIQSVVYINDKTFLIIINEYPRKNNVFKIVYYNSVKFVYSTRQL